MRSASASDVAKRNGYTKFVHVHFLLGEELMIHLLSILNYKGSWLEWTAKQSKKSS